MLLTIQSYPKILTCNCTLSKFSMNKFLNKSTKIKKVLNTDYNLRYRSAALVKF